MDKEERIAVRATGLIERDLGDAVVVMAGTGEELHTFQGSGLLLWKRIDGTTDIRGLVLALMDEYEVDEPRAAADSLAFVDTLLAKGLVTLKG